MFRYAGIHTHTQLDNIYFQKRKEHALSKIHFRYTCLDIYSPVVRYLPKELMGRTTGTRMRA